MVQNSGHIIFPLLVAGVLFLGMALLFGIEVIRFLRKGKAEREKESLTFWLLMGFLFEHAYVAFLLLWTGFGKHIM